MFAQRPQQRRVAVSTDSLRLSVYGKSNNGNISLRLSRILQKFSTRSWPRFIPSEKILSTKNAPVTRNPQNTQF